VWNKLLIFFLFYHHNIFCNESVRSNHGQILLVSKKINQCVRNIENLNNFQCTNKIVSIDLFNEKNDPDPEAEYPLVEIIINDTHFKFRNSFRIIENVFEVDLNNDGVLDYIFSFSGTGVGLAGERVSVYVALSNKEKKITWWNFESIGFFASDVIFQKKGLNTKLQMVQTHNVDKIKHTFFAFYNLEINNAAISESKEISFYQFLNHANHKKITDKALLKNLNSKLIQKYLLQIQDP
jgi:hypothetical protein